MLARYAGAAEAGKYGFALFTTAPIFMFFDLNLRVSRATDHQHGERFCNYVALRSLMLAMALVVSIVVAIIVSPQTFWVFLGVTLFRMGESLSNLSFGGFQRMQTSDLIGKSLTIKGLLVILVVGSVVVLLNGTAIFAAFAMATISIFFGVARDLPKSWKTNEPDLPLNVTELANAFSDVSSNFRIAKRSLPLGIDSFVSSLALNSPRYCIKWWFDRNPTYGMTGDAALGIFGVLSQLAFAIQMLIGAVGHTGVGMLSERYRNRQRPSFWRLFHRMFASSVVLGILAIIFGSLLIPPIMEHVFHDPGSTPSVAFLNSHYSNLWLIMFLLIASCLAGAQRTVGRATQACGQYFWYMAFDFVICITSILTAFYLVTNAGTAEQGLVGGAIAIAAGFAAGLVVTLIHTYTLLWKDGSEATVESDD